MKMASLSSESGRNSVPHCFDNTVTSSSPSSTILSQHFPHAPFVKRLG